MLSFLQPSHSDCIIRLNSRIKVVAIPQSIQPSNAVALLSPYDIILDCTDNAPTRYLLSDTAVLLGKPLVSGAAQKFEGQLCTYNLGEDGPCYRCLFPKPPSPEMTGSCAETGILGAVTGIIGNMQALEAIKIITGLHGMSTIGTAAYVIDTRNITDLKPSLLLFSALGIPPFRNIKLRSKKPTCPACGKEGQKVGHIQDIDYVQFCGGQQPDWVRRGLAEGDPGHRIHAKVHDTLFHTSCYC